MYTYFRILLLALLMSVNPLRAAAQKTVVFDESHGQKFLIEQNGPLGLSGLSALFHNEGLRVKTNKGEITGKVLAEADALVISGAFLPVSSSEITAILRFVEQGGRLCVMLHIGFPVKALMQINNRQLMR